MSELPEGFVAVQGHEEFLAKKVIREGKDGDENKAANGCELAVHYTGTLEANGQKFDSSRDKDKLFKFKLGAGEVIKGWDFGMATMRVGERSILRIHPNYGYGKAGAGGVIPGGATLIFDVELFSVTQPTTTTTGGEDVVKYGDVTVNRVPQSETKATPGEEDDDGEAEVKREKRTKEEEEDLLRVCASDVSIELNSLRIFSLDEIPLEKFTNCTSLSIRKNLLHDLTPFPPELCERLEELDFFDNKIRKIGGKKCKFFIPDLTVTPAVNNFCKLSKLDLSYNQIGHIEGLDALAPTLTELYLVENKIKEITGLEKLVNLKLLELGGNKLREVGPGLTTLVNLEQLWLGKNKISTLGTGFTTLKKLFRLSLQANRLTDLDPATFATGELPELKELYLSENGLSNIEKIGQLPNLELIDFSFNPIKSLNCAGCLNVSNFPLLNEFWLTDGKVEDWQEVEDMAPFKDTLRTVYLERNPIERDKRYRNKVHLALPFLDQIDSWPIINKQNPEADRAIRRAN